MTAGRFANRPYKAAFPLFLRVLRGENLPSVCLRARHALAPDIGYTRRCIAVPWKGCPPVKISRAQVEHIADLAKLDLTDAEVELYADQLSAILDYVEQLNQIDTSAIPPTASVLPLSNVLRPDAAAPSLPTDAALANAPDAAEGQFRVSAVLDESP